MRISEELVKKSLDIIKRHEALLNKLNSVQQSLELANTKLNQYKNEIDNIGEENLENKTKIYEILISYEDEIKKLSKDTKPYIDELETLKKESSLLYLKIKELFPNKKDEEIQKILFHNMDEYSKKYNL